MTNEKKVNRDLIIGWSFIVGVLFVTYLIEVVKGERTLPYVIVFTLITALPALICGLIYRRNPVNHNLRYFIIIGYSIMYVFVMCSGSTIMVFTYILPMLSLLILYHQPRLILWTGIGTLLVNVAFIVVRVTNNQITIDNSKDVEIQIALIVFCFSGCFAASVLYDEINRKNKEYIKEIAEKSDQIHRMTLQTIETIANTIDAKDEYTRGHSRRVSEYAVIIAKELQMTEEEIMNIRYIALLHDIGKIGVPDSVLNKPGRLTDLEFELMKKHTTIGGHILKDIGMLTDLNIGAQYHHERYDGKGYPNGLKGEEIPKIARIICIADAYDAMTSKRVYRNPLTKEEVLNELRRCKGTQFDPDITEVFLNYLENASEWIIDSTEENRQTSDDVSNVLLQRIMKDQNQRLHWDMQLDELTGVYTRSAGEKKIISAMEKGQGCLALVNLGNMRYINNQYGYRQGDYYLQMVAEMLKDVTTDIIVSRFSGDEFLCYVPNVTDSEQIKEQIRDFVKEVQIRKNQDAIIEDIHISLGVTIHDRNDVEFRQLLMEADKALYHVKQDHDSGYYFYRQVANRTDDNIKVDWRSVLDTMQRRKSMTEMDITSDKDLIRVYDMILDKEKQKNVSLVMFTAKEEQENPLSVEAKQDVMRMIEYAILQTLQDEEIITKYSSVQRIVMLTDNQEKNVHELMQSVLTNFYKMYDKNNVELYYDIAEVYEDGLLGKN